MNSFLHGQEVIQAIPVIFFDSVVFSSFISISAKLGRAKDTLMFFVVDMEKDYPDAPWRRICCPAVGHVVRGLLQLSVL